MLEPKDGDLKVWWIPQVPGKAFEFPVPSLLAGRFMLNLLAKYDLFQFENLVKPDYSNVGGIMVFEENEWVDWCSEDGDEFDDMSEAQLAANDKKKGRTHELGWVF
jgi:hypothetical protein